MEEKHYIGIDLGTSYCSVAYLDDTGTPLIEPNFEGETETPSVIFVNPEGDIVIGTEAKGKEHVYYNQTASGFKTKMGQNVTISVGNSKFTPIELSSMVLKKLCNDFKRTRGISIEEAVITIPASFGDSQREATRTAAAMAGIQNVTLVNEPTAAAVAYGYGHCDGGHKRILVFDLGGGTCDITILDIDGSQFNAIAIDGDIVGGRDWDDRMGRILIDKIAAESGTDPTVLDTDPLLLSILEVKREAIKIRLSYSDITQDTITLNNGIKTMFEVTREEFEEASGDLVDECMDLVERALKSIRCTASDMDAFVMVGGSSRMPMVSAGLKARFPDARLELFEPNHAVAKGAALYAGRSPDNPVGNILSKTFGVKVAVGGGGSQISNIIYRNKRLPETARGKFHPEQDGQLTCYIEIYESNAEDGDKHTAVEDAKSVGRFELKLPESVTVDTPINVQFTADAEGILTAIAECGNRREKYTLESPVKLTDEQVDASKKLMDKVA